MMRAAPGDHDRVWYEIAIAVDQVATDTRDAAQRSFAADVDRLRRTTSEVSEKFWERRLGRPEKDGYRRVLQLRRAAM